MDIADAKNAAKGVLLLVLMIVVVGAVIATQVPSNPGETIDEDTLLYPNNEGTLSNDYSIKNFQAQQTLGNTVKFNGQNNSYLKGSADINKDQTWTVSTWAKLDTSVNQNAAEMRVLRLSPWFYLDYNQTNWRVTYYNQSSLNTYHVSINAPSPDTWTHITAQTNGSHLFVYRNNSLGATIELTDGTSSIESFDAENLHGTVEETRVLDANITDSQRQTLYDSPTHPVKASEKARIYYDTWDDENTIDVYRTGTDLTMSNVQVVDGFSGESVSSGTDYDRNGDTVTALSNGNLDGAPVVFTTYSFEFGPLGSTVELLISIGQVAFILVGLAILAYSAKIVTDQVDSF